MCKTELLNNDRATTLPDFRGHPLGPRVTGWETATRDSHGEGGGLVTDPLRSVSRGMLRPGRRKNPVVCGFLRDLGLKVLA